MESGNIQNLLKNIKPSGEGARNIALVARQPIFDLTGEVWGYELLFRDPSMKPGLGGKDSQAATSTVMSDGLELMQPMLRNRQRFFINFTSEFLAAELPAVLPSDICVVEILETVEPTQNVMQGILNLKKQGYVFALDDYTGQKHLKPFIPLVDIVKVDTLELSFPELQSLANDLQRYPVRLLAEKVENNTVAEQCKQCGFSLFQGFFYSKPELVQGKKLTPSQITKVRLLSLAADPEAELEHITQVISTDVFLSYKVLKLINSVYFGLEMQVRHVEHAVSMLGSKRTRQWLCVTALAEMDASPMAQELVYLSAQRARFLELLGKKYFAGQAHEKASTAKLFLIGLFSLLECMLRMPMSEIFESVPLDENILQVLTQKTGQFSPWYQLMLAYEEGDWAITDSIAKQLRLHNGDLTSAYVEAGVWSSKLFTFSAKD